MQDSGFLSPTDEEERGRGSGRKEEGGGDGGRKGKKGVGNMGRRRRGEMKAGMGRGEGE